MSPHMPEGSVPGTRPYVPGAPPPDGRTPAERPPSSLPSAALALSLLLCFGFPVLLIALALSGGSSGDSFDAMVWSLPAGALLCVGTFILSIVALTRLRGSGGRTAMAIAALVFTLLSPLTSLAVFVVCTFLLAGGAGHGRPLRKRDGRPVVTPDSPTEAWRTGCARPDVRDLDEPTRTALAQAWLDDASLEHASIAAFGKLSLELVAIGAPPALLVEAHRAALDEIEHARVAYAFASAYAGEARGAGPLPEASSSARPESPGELVARLVVESVVDGMVGEAAAADVAAIVTARTVDPIVAAALARVAEDESRHAALATAIVRHCAAHHPADAARGLQRARAALARVLERRPQPPVETRMPGRPTSAEVDSARRRAALAALAALAELDVIGAPAVRAA